MLKVIFTKNNQAFGFEIADEMIPHYKQYALKYWEEAMVKLDELLALSPQPQPPTEEPKEKIKRKYRTRKNAKNKTRK